MVLREIVCHHQDSPTALITTLLMFAQWLHLCPIFWVVQLRTNKDNNFDISRTTEFFSNLTSDLNSECQKTSENMLFINFPRVVKVAKSLGELLGHLGTF